MTEEVKEKQKLAEIARKKRHLHLIEKLHGGAPLTKPEIRELEEFEAEPLPPAIVRTVEEVAKVMEVSCRTVQRWKKDGLPVTPEGFYDLSAVQAWREARGGRETEGRAYWEEKIRKYKATLLGLELKQIKGELVSREDVEQGRVVRIMAVKRALLVLPSRLAPVLSMREPRDIEKLLYDAIAEIVDEFAKDSGSHKKTGPYDLDPSGTSGVETA